MAQEEPRGYQEIGESLAMPLAEGLMSESSALELARLLGYKKADLAAWLDHYRSLHGQELESLERKRKQTERKISRWKHRAKELRQAEPGA